MLSALSVVLLYLGSFIEILDLSVALVASLVTVVLVIERGGVYPWLVYGVTAALALLLVPNKTPAIVYACFMGFYPILKEKLERLSLRLLRLAVKLAVFNASLALIWGVATLLMGGVTFGMHIAIVIVMLNLIFVFYDYALSVMITGYLRVWRKRLRVDRFFKEK